MKKLYLFIVLLFISLLGLQATNYTSAQNGNWMSPTTWTPMGVPLPGDNITINHVVTLDTSFVYTSGTISILGTLTHDSFGRDLWLNGSSAQFMSSGIVTLDNILVSSGIFTNSGTLNVNVVANFGTFTNNSSMSGVDSLYNDGTFTNNLSLSVSTFYNNSTMNNYGQILGLVAEVDSMYNTGTFLNDVNASLYADSCTNANTFTNNGYISFNQFTNLAGTFTNTSKMDFTDMTNVGTFDNQDTLTGTGSVTNTGIFTNSAGAYFDLAVSFLNTNIVNNNATFTADGRFEIGDSFYNFDIINGTAPGSIEVADTSYNSGAMNGTFDFCDLTPSSTPPTDFNLGTIAGTISFCAYTGVKKLYNNDFTLYPNPTTSIVNIQFNEAVFIEVYNMLGEQVIVTQQNQVDLSNNDNGVYLFRIKDREGKILSLERIIKQ